MGTPLRVLIVEDSEDDALLLVRELKHGGYDPISERVETAESMKAALEKQKWDIILADYVMPHFSGLNALKLLQKGGLDIPFIIVSGSIGEDTAVAAMKAGANDYLMKDKLARLVPAIEQEIREAGVRRKLKHSEKALQEAEKRYRQVVENAVEIIYTTDAKGNFTYANDAALKTVGYSLAELQRFNYLDLVVPEYRDRLSKIYINQFREKQATTYVEFPFICKAGEILWFGQNSTLVMEEDKIVGFHIISRDITERKKMEEVLRKSEEKYRTILENIEEGYYEVDLAGNFTFLNDSMCRIFGYPKEELIGMNNRQYTDKDSAKRLFQAFNEVYRTGKPDIGYGYEIIRKDGTKRYIEASILLQKDSSDKPIGFRGIIRDITERKRAEEALGESEQRYRNLVENAPDVIFTLAPDGTITSLNPAFEAITGWSQSEWLGKAFTTILRPDDLSRGLEFFRSVLKGEKTAPFELGALKESGDYLTAEFTVTPQTQNGSVMGVLGIARDITDHKRAEEALKKSEERFRLASEASSDLMYEWDIKERVDWFGKIDELLGYAPNEFPRSFEAWANNVHPDDRDRVITAVKNHSEKNEPYNIEYRVRKKDGTYNYWWARGTAIRDEKGNPYRWVGAITDVTERKRAEEALRSSENRYKTLIENVPQKIFLKDKSSVYISCNENYARDLKIKPDEISGRTDYDFYPKELAEKYRIDDKTIMERGKTEELEEKYIQNGHEVWVNTIKTLVKDEKGNLIGILGIFRDITERKRAEEEKVALVDQLRQSQKMEAIGKLAGGIAHDFNNLLTVISGNCQLSLLELKEDVPLKGNIEEIKRASERAADLTRQLLAFSRRQIMEMKVLDLNDLFRNLDKMLRRVIGEDIELVTILDENLGRVKTDTGQIEQVIMNLVVNARDAMPKGGKLTIETANVDLDGAYARAHVAVKPGPYVMLAVSDTGVGMTPEVKERVFEPFFTTKDKGKGTGLGLSTVYGIVKQSGGNIWVYSEPGKGTTFKIYLPRVDEPLEESKGEVKKEGLPQGSETILIVEDDEDVRKFAARVLEKQGYTVLVASQGSDALPLCGEYKKPIHMVLCDVVMPGVGGRELTDHLISLHPEMKVLYMSGYTENTIVHHGILIEGMNYIQKPFTVEGLVRKVKEALDK